MEPTPPPPPPHVPLTPLGARTPHTHPALYGVITALSLIIIVAGAWTLWPKDAAEPSPSPTPSGVVTGGTEYVVYTNTQFGLRISLPDSWMGYRTISEEGEGAAWHGTDVVTAMEIESGPMVVLRHPNYTDAVPRQDIPIMVFTPKQWSAVLKEEISLGAAPIPPSVLASNSQFIFALPARYNYAFPEGWEEVQAIIDNGGISASETTTATATLTPLPGWKMYTSTEHGFQFFYPPDWMIATVPKTALTQLATAQVVLRSPSTEQALDAGTVNPGYSHDLVVSFYDDASAWAGEAGPGSPTYLGTIPLNNGRLVKEYLKVGQGQNYAVVIEAPLPSLRMWELSFETARESSTLSDQQRLILSSFLITN